MSLDKPIRFIWSALAGLVAVSVPVFAIAQASRVETPREISIPAGKLIDALDKLGNQSGVQIICEAALAQDVKVRALSGTLTVKEALDQLLANTGLKADSVNGKTVVLKRAADSSSNAGPAAQMRVANGAGVVLAANKGPAEPVESSRDQVTVQGQRDRPLPFSTANLDLTRTEDDILPFTVFTAREIELSGSGNVEDFLRNRLPQNLSDAIPEEVDGGGMSEQDRVSSVNFRGWGSTETVFLLNGRRMGAQYWGVQGDVSNATPDLRSIPLASIERIEILSSAGSAIYGAGATGGVINIITRRDYRGGQVSVKYDSPVDVQRPQRSVDFSYGLPLVGGFGLRLSAGFNDSEPMTAGDRADVTIGRWRRLGMQRAPERLLNLRPGTQISRAVFYGATPNIRTASAGPAANLFGANTPNFTAVPAGYSGEGTIDDFTPGVYNLDLSDDRTGTGLYARGSRIGVATRDTSATVGIDRNFGERWQWSIDYRLTQNKSNAQSTGGALQLSGDFNYILQEYLPIVPAGAAVNPFGQEVIVSFIDPRLRRPELRNRPENVTHEISSTLRAELGAWRGFFDFSLSENRNQLTEAAYYEPAGGWHNAVLSGAYNPFVDMRQVAPAAPSFYEDYIAIRAMKRSATRSYVSAVKFSGPLVSMRAGALQLTAGLDWMRTDRYRLYWYGEYQDGLTGAPRAPSGRTGTGVVGSRDSEFFSYGLFVFDTYSAYSEVNVPLVSSAQSLPFIHGLELTASGRVSEERRNGSNGGMGSAPVPVDYGKRPHVLAYGLRYEPIEGVALRVSSSTGFIPPGINDFSPADPPVSEACCDLVDPARDDEPVLLDASQWVYGGNPGIRAETTRSANIGLILSPARAPGLRLSVDYIENVRNDAISSIDLQTMIRLEREFPGRIRRDAPEGGSSEPGPINFVDGRSINLAEIRSRSMDLSLRQEISGIAGGKLVLSAAAIKNISFRIQYSADSPALEQVRNREATLFSQQVKWNANAQAQWEGQRWGFGWSARFYDSLLVLEDDQQFQGGDHVPWKVDHDLNINYRIEPMGSARGIRAMFSGSSLSFGVQNVFNREPRFWAAGIERGVAPFDSVVGRSAWLQLRRQF